MFKELKQEFSKLSEEQKKMVLGLVQGLNS